MKRLMLLMMGCILAIPSARAGEIVVSAAASLSESLRELAAQFEATTHQKVALNFGASGTLALQIEKGAPVDVFVSADDLTMDRLQKSGAIDPATRHVLLTNALVVVVPADSRQSVRSGRDLLAPAIRRIAIGQWETVPAGRYARAWLERARLWSNLQSRLVPTEDVRGALAAVAAGNADAAIVYRTDARTSSRVRIAFAPRDVPPITYSVATVKESRNRDAAMKFVMFLQSAQAKRVFRRLGFDVGPK